MNTRYAMKLFALFLGSIAVAKLEVHYNNDMKISTDTHDKAMQAATTEMRLTCFSNTNANDQSNPTVHIGEPQSQVGKCTDINVAGNYRSTCDSVSTTLEKRRICHCIVPAMMNPKCSQGWDFFNDSCFRPFRLLDVIRQWTAESICQEHHGHLAALTTDDQFEFVKNNYFYFIKDGSEFGWMGAVDDYPRRESGQFFEFMTSKDDLYPGYYSLAYSVMAVYRSSDDTASGGIKLRITNRNPNSHKEWVACEKPRAKFTKGEDGWTTAKDKLFKIIAITDTLTNNKARCTMLKAVLAEPLNAVELDVIAKLIEKFTIFISVEPVRCCVVMSGWEGVSSEYAPGPVPADSGLAFIGGSYQAAPRSIKWFDPDFESIPVTNLNPKYSLQYETNQQFCFWLKYVGGAADHLRMVDMWCHYQTKTFIFKKPAHETIDLSKKTHFMYERIRDQRMTNGRVKSYQNISDVICHHFCSNLVNCYGVNYHYTESMCELVERKPEADQFSQTLGWYFFARKHTYVAEEE